MRSLKAVLELASNFKLKNPNDSEERIIMNSLYINTLPKLVFQDAHLFKEILKDIFPNTDIPSNSSALYKNILKVTYILIYIIIIGGVCSLSIPKYVCIVLVTSKLQFFNMIYTHIHIYKIIVWLSVEILIIKTQLSFYFRKEPTFNVNNYNVNF